MPKLLCDINEVFTAHSEDLKKVEREILNLFSSSSSVIPAIGHHILSGGGKRIRPLFLILSAKLCGYHDYPLIILAGIIEAIHTASLLHDDVIDGAESRRGKAPAHAIWGNQIVVLVGDFLYSNALRIAVQQNSQKIMEALSEATTRMTEGELLQLGNIGNPDINEEVYMQIISGKTGALISAACRIGAILGGMAEPYEIALARFGMKIGQAFQMADDILDYTAVESELGKQLGKDLNEGKITKPLIDLLRACDEQERNEVKRIINNTNDPGSITDISLLFEKYNVIDESMKSAMSLVEEAKKELDLFTPSPTKDALLCLADYALHRSN
jgi:octaprenyl-diphosphate synthase